MEVIDDERFYDRFNFDPEGGGFEPCTASYVKTADTDIVSGKEYYTESSGSYTKVSGTPSKSALDTYYEKVAGSHKINVLIATPETTKIVPPQRTSQRRPR
jgi:hypothetical protein